MGQGVEPNYITAIEYYEQAVKLGNPLAMRRLGFLYEGQGVEQNYTKAIEYYKQAAKLGISCAIISLGFLYEEGQGVE